MADVTQKYGTTNQTITLTIASLANASSRESTVIDNGTTLFLDVKIALKIKTNASGTSTTGRVDVFAYGTADGTNYSGGATGTDAAFTANLDQLVYLGSVPAVANATTYTALFSLSRGFGHGGIPAKWGIVIQNNSGAALDATGGNHSAVYQGVYATVN